MQVNSQQTLLAAITVILVFLSSLNSIAFAEDQDNAEATEAQTSSSEKESRKSPWVATPLLSSNPKFGTSIGGLAAYLHHFDDKSPVSMFGLTGNYSDTRSYSGVAFANAFFDEDKQRVKAAVVYGKIENDYEDFLGTGKQLQTSDDINLVFARYLHRIAGKGVR